MTSPPLRITTFNIRYGSAQDGSNSWANRQQLLYKTVDRLRPDILVLQEAEHFQIVDIIGGLQYLKFEYIGVGRDDGHERGEYAPILYNPSIFRPTASGTFWLTDGDSSHPGPPAWGAPLPRICTWAAFEFTQELNRAFVVFNCHLDHQSRLARVKSAEMIAKRITEEWAGKGWPLFVTGDFNNLSDSADEIKVMGQAGFADSFEVAARRSTEEDLPRGITKGTFHGFTGRALTGTPKMDFIWMNANANAKVVDAGIFREGENGRWPSDHFPVFASIQF
ncbi:hypothetical protein HK104_006759 [Borealophlyctis nickersoniae]|nr:hypothetical protein HK104_006759 [Borealophlyctis nickersoniae]